MSPAFRPSQSSPPVGTSSSDNIILKFNGKKMDQCSTYKYLGVHLDENLNWKAHVDYLCKKLSKMCGIFSKLRHCCSKDLMKAIYFALVESHMQYCNMIWGNANQNVLKPLINLQNKIMKIICFAPYSSDEVESLYVDLKLLSLQKLHKLSKAKFMFKFKMQIYLPILTIFLQPHIVSTIIH